MSRKNGYRFSRLREAPKLLEHLAGCFGGRRQAEKDMRPNKILERIPNPSNRDAL
jgi:hypothetical protein